MNPTLLEPFFQGKKIELIFPWFQFVISRSLRNVSGSPNYLRLVDLNNKQNLFVKDYNGNHLSAHEPTKNTGWITSSFNSPIIVVDAWLENSSTTEESIMDPLSTSRSSTAARQIATKFTNRAIVTGKLCSLANGIVIILTPGASCLRQRFGYLGSDTWCQQTTSDALPLFSSERPPDLIFAPAAAHPGEILAHGWALHTSTPREHFSRVQLDAKSIATISQASTGPPCWIESTKSWGFPLW